MDQETAYGRIVRGIVAALPFTFAAAPAWAQDAALKIDPADTAWMISATGLVLMMTIPGLALFYCGMVRKKNVLATMAQSFACTGLCSLLWFFAGYTLAFVGDGSWLGTFERVFLRGIGMEATSAFAPTIPELLFVFYQMTLPPAGSSSSMCRSRIGCGAAVFSPARACLILPAALSSTSMPASRGWSLLMWSANVTATVRTISRPTTFRLR
jgi:hypothetical protein